MKLFKGASGNSDGLRCCRFLRLARRAIAAISAAISEREHNAANRKKMRNPLGGIQWGAWRCRSVVKAPLGGFSSFAPCHPPHCIFAQPIRVSGGALNSKGRVLFVVLQHVFIGFFILLSGIVLSARAQDVAKAKETALDAANANEMELVRRQESLIHSQYLLQEAQELLTQHEWEKALAKYQEVQKKMSEAPATAEQAGQLYKGMSVALYELAQISCDREEFAKAAELAGKAYQADPENKNALLLSEQAANKNEKIEEISRKKSQVAAELPREISNSEFVAKQKKVLELYRAADNYYKSEQFDQAEVALKDILRIDPYSANAYHRLREVQLAKYNKLNAAKLQTETESMLDVQKGWQMPLRRDRIKTTASEGDSEEIIGSMGGKKEIMRKLNSILIKKMDFEHTPITTAIKTLIDESRELDPEKTGITIIYRPPGGSAVAATAPVPPTDSAAAASSSETTLPVSSGVPLVDLNVRGLPLLQVIKLLTIQTSLRYRIDPDLVVIYSGEDVSGRLQTRVLPVAPAVFQPLVEKTNSGSSTGGSGFGPGISGSSNATASKNIDAKKYFEDFGILFPPGTSARYIDSIGQLVVTHTSEVMDQIEGILLKLNKVVPQVQVEAKFIDVRQDQLDELGFRWAFAPATQHQYTLESGQGTALSGIAIGGPYRGLGNPLTGGNRNAASLSVSALDGLLAGSGGAGLIAAGANTVLTVTGVLTNPQVQVMIDALARKGLTNLLSAPRVTTQSGEQAKIMITREFIYPSAFTDPQVQAGTSSSTGGTGSVGIVAPSPSAFTTKEIGVILDVRPTVGPDGSTITMALTPQVLDFEGFVYYNTFAIANSTQFTFSIPQPIFNKREISTTVIIWDQQTIVLGGLIREDVTKVNDKIPFLGDIPFLGRLFQSKVEQSIKKNLMIFLNAKIVDPSGKPVKPIEEISFSPATAVETH